MDPDDELETLEIRLLLEAIHATYLKDRVLHKFTESLCPGGFLCLGSGERVSRSAKEHALVEFATERIYRYEA
jgi:chemotaxis methyl-accepting protein methylase